MVDVYVRRYFGQSRDRRSDICVACDVDDFCLSRGFQLFLAPGGSSAPRSSGFPTPARSAKHNWRLGSMIPCPIRPPCCRAAIQEVRICRRIAACEAGIKERAASRFSDVVRTEARAATPGHGELIATIGATAPFVGLFGTVWGIMNSFIGISKTQTTNLAVVAPGIAEALLATAVGLAAAIPAVIIYNHFSRATKGYMDLVGRGSGAVGRLLLRDLDRFHGRMISRAAE